MKTTWLMRPCFQAALGLGLVMSSVLLAAAQDGTFRERIRERLAERGVNPKDALSQLLAKLELSPEQESQLKPIMEKQRKIFEEIAQDDSLTREEKAAEFREVAKETRRQVEPILTPEQNARLDAIIAEQKKKREAIRRRIQERSNNESR